MLRLTYEPEDEWHGELHAFVQTPDFSGRSSAWFNRDALISFSRSLDQYPLPSHEPVGIYGGLGTVSLDRPEEVLLGLTIASVGLKGELLVRVELASDPAMARRAEVQQSALLCFLTEYAALDRFRNALGPMLNGDVEAILKGT
jgi:hypothetical protein